MLDEWAALVAQGGWVREEDVPPLTSYAKRRKLEHKLMLVFPKKAIYATLSVNWGGGGDTPCWALCR